MRGGGGDKFVGGGGIRFSGGGGGKFDVLRLGGGGGGGKLEVLMLVGGGGGGGNKLDCKLVGGGGGGGKLFVCMFWGGGGGIGKLLVWGFCGRILLEDVIWEDYSDCCSLFSSSLAFWSLKGSLAIFLFTIEGCFEVKADGSGKSTTPSKPIVSSKSISSMGFSTGR